MANKIKQYYGIKYPFTNNNYDGHFIDLNTDIDGSVASEIAHVILTRKGTRIRKPEFGTKLINYIFDPNDELTWENIQDEIKTEVGRYVPNAVINDVAVIASTKDGDQATSEFEAKKTDDGITVITAPGNGIDIDSTIYLDVKYGVVKGATIENNRMMIKL